MLHFTSARTLPWYPEHYETTALFILYTAPEIADYRVRA